MKGLIQFLYPLFRIIPMSFLIRLSGKKVLLPFYHTVSDEDLAHITNLYSLRTKVQFRDDMVFFQKHFHSVSLKELSNIVHAKSAFNRPVFHISFDDGLSGVYDNAFPILKEKHTSFTVFINSAFVDNKELFFRYKVSLIIDKLFRCKVLVYEQLSAVLGVDKDHLIASLKKLKYSDTALIDQLGEKLGLDWSLFLKKRPYMSLTELKELQQNNGSIGAHSVDHPLFNELDLESQKNQVDESVLFVSDHFNEEVISFAFPFGDEGVSVSFLDWLKEQVKCAVSFGVSGLKEDVLSHHLHRIPMEGTAYSAEKLVKTEYVYYILKRVIGKHRVRRV